MKSEGKNLLAVCAHFRREVQQVLEEESGLNVELVSFPAYCGHPKVYFTQAMERLTGNLAQNDQLAVVCSACCFEPVADNEQPMGCETFRLEQCFHLVANPTLVDALVEQGAYLVTPGWLESWKSRIEEWGFDQEGAQDFFQESARRIVHLDTNVSDDAGKQLVEFGDFVGLPTETVPVGLERLRSFVVKTSLAWELKKEKQRRLRAEQRVSELSMAVEVMGEVASITADSKPWERIFDLFLALCAPRRVVCVLLDDEGNADAMSIPDGPVDVESVRSRLEDSSSVPDSKPGEDFIIPLALNEELLGILAVEGLAFPQFRPHYVNLGRSLSRVLALGLANRKAASQLHTSIHELEAARGELSAALEELERSNKDLEAFAYLASHDLQAPARRIVSFVKLLRANLESNLDEDCDRLFTFVENEASQMRALIQDLLQFSRAGRANLKLVPLDVEEIVAAVAKRMKDDPAGPQGAIERKELPTISGDRTQISQLFQNLIENGLKYNRSDAPKVSVSSRTGDGIWHFTITDNGLGIPEQHFATVLEPFRRLHSGGAYPGTGVGLAICVKVVERHNGRLWLESAPGGGMKFHFTLPALDSLLQQ
jgi:signal transduction histidine kinase